MAAEQGENKKHTEYGQEDEHFTLLDAAVTRRRHTRFGEAEKTKNTKKKKMVAHHAVTTTATTTTTTTFHAATHRTRRKKTKKDS